MSAAPLNALEKTLAFAADRVEALEGISQTGIGLRDDIELGVMKDEVPELKKAIAAEKKRLEALAVLDKLHGRRPAPPPVSKEERARRLAEASAASKRAEEAAAAAESALVKSMRDARAAPLKEADDAW